MDWELLESWGIGKDSDPKKICEELEERQLAFLQMRRNENDSVKKNEIAEELKKLETQLKQAKKEVKKQLESSEPDSAGIVSEPDPQTMPDSSTTPVDIGTIPLGDSKQQLQSGIAEYTNGNYDAAFSIFNDLAQKEDPEAEYYVSMMFRKGLGTTSDNDRANFWLKKSADHRYVEAQFAYAMTLLSNRSGTDPLSKEGMQYLAKAADQDHQPSMKQYVDIVLKGYHELPAIRSAIRYSSGLQALLSDQYEVEVYKNKEDQLKNLLSEGERHESDERVMKVIEILSPILLVFGFLYLLGGIHPNEWDNNALLKFFPDAPGILIIPFRLFWVLILPVMSVNGKFGLEIITAAYACRSFYKAKQNIKIKNAVSAVSKFVIAAIIVWHLLLMIIEGMSFVEGVVFFVIAIIVCRVFGFIISKIFVTVSNAKTVGKKVGLSIAFVAALVVISILTARIPAINENTGESAVETTDTVKVSDNDNKVQSFSVELVHEDTSDCRAIDVASVEADSVLVSSKGNRYEPELMIDGDTTTSWQEGEDGAGEGQVFLAKFDDDQKVDYVVIHNGNHKSEKLYYNNNRIKSLNITINGQSVNIELEDSMDPQVIRINGAESVNEVRFEIAAVYSGEKYNDTCVTEVQFLCR